MFAMDRVSIRWRFSSLPRMSESSPNVLGLGTFQSGFEQIGEYSMKILGGILKVLQIIDAVLATPNVPGSSARARSENLSFRSADPCSPKSCFGPGF